jgi:hypothetical protein
MAEPVVYYTGEYTSTTEPVVYYTGEYTSMTELVVYYTGEYTITTEPVVYKLYRRVYWYDRACGTRCTVRESTTV